ncbi:MAG: FHA domain-containing protein [Actinomycetota bacterium]|nr:FHA domain-containing protein [Actinomycetota bacterium]
MGVLQRFERRLEGLVEGAFARVFKGEVQPVEVAGALQRETDDKKAIVSQGRTLVPNDFVVELGESDHARLSPYAEPLGDELAAMVREHAAERGYSFVGPVQVRFEQVEDLDTGMFRIRSGVVAGPSTDGRPARAEAPDPAKAAGGPDPTRSIPLGAPRLVVLAGGPAAPGARAGAETGAELPLTKPVTVVGRGADCDVRLDDPGVSRRHAELRLSGPAVVLVDLGSTNGTSVNDERVERRDLVDGDRIRVGSSDLAFRSDASPASGR